MISALTLKMLRRISFSRIPSDVITASQRNALPSPLTTKLHLAKWLELKIPRCPPSGKCEGAPGGIFNSSQLSYWAISGKSAEPIKFARWANILDVTREKA